MIITKIIIFTLLALSLEAGDCWKIKNKDQRVLCESKYENKKFCWKIKDKDIQAYCNAVVSSKNTCWKIQNNDAREMCKAERHWLLKR